MHTTLRRALFLSLASFLASCATDGTPDRDYSDSPPLANVDELLAGAPKADDITPIDRKADETLPVSHATLLDWQSPVRSQGRRGVCSIFSTVALMEHLYLKQGSIAEPDFSEEFLQWSAKFEVNSFPNTSGSNATYNMQAINRFGIVDEATYPYRIDEWNQSDDPECSGEDDQPTRCYTNGHPSDEIKNAERYKLPSGRWLRADDIKSHIQQNDTAVIVGLTFFYQSWNHSRSQLPRSVESWDQGFVTYPSAEDKKVSLEKRAGHSVLVLGWDDNQEMPTLDENGKPVVDQQGDVVTEKGCYIFKNSWGTDGFGIDSNWGPGYGCISQRYVEEFGRVRVSRVPRLAPPKEICGDEIDNDNNGQTDCDDSVCVDELICLPTGTKRSFQGPGDIDIPDNDLEGIGSTIVVPDEGTLRNLRVEVDISHSYRSDLRVSLHHGTDVIVLHSNSGGGADDLALDLDLQDWNGTQFSGAYRLVIVDGASADLGRLNSWRLTATIAD